MTNHEKRKFTRIDLDYVTVEVYNCTSSSETEVTEICSMSNISETGMMFRGGHPYQSGQVIRLTFVLPDTMIIIRTDALVVHMHGSVGNCSIGVQFKNLGLAERKLISHIVQKIQA